MKNTTETAKKYAEQDKNFGYSYSLTPKCQQGMGCASPCDWGGKKALDRIV